MRKTTAAAILSAAIALSQTATAGIPVTVVADVPGQVAQIQNFTQMLKDYAALKSQLETMTRSLDSISGSRGLANLIDSAYDTTVEVNANEVLAAAGIKSASDHGLTGSAADLYDSGNSDAATWLAQSEKSLEQAQERFSDLTGLVAKVNASPDQKDILDLQARIGAEEVLLQNEIVKLSMLQSKAQANQAMYEQQLRQRAIESAGEAQPYDW